MLTMTGKEWKSFYDSPLVWTKDSYWEDARVLVNGVEDDNDDLRAVQDAAVITVDGGYIVDQVPGAPDDLEKAIDWWRKQQSTTSLSIEVPNEKLEAVRAALSSLGVKIL